MISDLATFIPLKTLGMSSNTVYIQPRVVEALMSAWSALALRCYRSHVEPLSWPMTTTRRFKYDSEERFTFFWSHCTLYMVYSLNCISVLMGIIIGYFNFQSIVRMPLLLLTGTFGRVCSAEQLRAQMPQCGRAGCTMPTGWRVKLCTGAPSASHQDHDRWSSVQANFLLLWLCLLSGLISNAVMKSGAIGGKGKVWFFLFFQLVLQLAVGGRLKGHLVSFFAVECCSNKSLLQPVLHNNVRKALWVFQYFLTLFNVNSTALHALCQCHHGQIDLLGGF